MDQKQMPQGEATVDRDSDVTPPKNIVFDKCKMTTLFRTHQDWPRRNFALAGLVFISMLVTIACTMALLTTRQWLLTVQFQPDFNVRRSIVLPTPVLSSIPNVVTGASAVASQVAGDTSQRIHDLEQAAAIALRFGTRQCCVKLAGTDQCIASPLMASLLAGLSLESVAAISTTVFLTRCIGPSQNARNEFILRPLKWSIAICCMASFGLYLSFFNAVWGVQEVANNSHTGTLTVKTSISLAISLLPVVMPIVAYVALEAGVDVAQDVDLNPAEEVSEVEELGHCKVTSGPLS